jgi:hypothetical protein
MVGLGMPVRRGMPAGRIVAAAYVPARHAHSQVHPAAAGMKAVLTAVAGGYEVTANRVQVRAGISHGWLPAMGSPSRPFVGTVAISSADRSHSPVTAAAS